MASKRGMELPEQVIKLTNCSCYLGSFPSGTAFYTRYPIINPSPCLAIPPISSGDRSWKGFLAWLPCDASHIFETKDSIFSAIALLTETASPSIDKIRSAQLDLVHLEVPKSGPPFVDASRVEQEKLIDLIEDSLNDKGLFSPEIRDVLDQTKKRLQNQTSSDYFLLHLCDIDVKKHRENWALLQAWDELTKGNPFIEDFYDSWRELIEPHRKDRAFLSQQKPGPKPSTSKRQGIDALRHRIQYLQLPQLKRRPKRKG